MIKLLEFIKENKFVLYKDGKALTSDEELTLMCMHVSEQSLKDGWENEDDAYWESFLMG
jgi:hypothetical protein